MACLGLLVAVAVSCCAEPAKSPQRRRLPPQPRSVQDCMNRYGQGADSFDACVAIVSVRDCMDRYGQGKVIETIMPILGGVDDFDACVAKAQDRWKPHAARAEAPVRKANAGAADDGGPE